MSVWINIFIILFSISIYAQDTCITYIDSINHITDGSFEDTICCPDYLSSLNCSKHWSRTNTTPDLHHSCGFIGQAIIDAGLYPFPDGEAIVGGYAFDYNPPVWTGANWHEYIISCATIIGGNQYEIKLNIASIEVDPDYLVTCSSGRTYTPIEITVFGIETPSTYLNRCQTGVVCRTCPTTCESGWIELGSFSYTPPVHQWEEKSTIINPPFDIGAIAIGAPCNLPPEYSFNLNTNYCPPYILYDNIKVTEVVIIICNDNNPCTVDQCVR